MIIPSSRYLAGATASGQHLPTTTLYRAHLGKVGPGGFDGLGNLISKASPGSLPLTGEQGRRQILEHIQNGHELSRTATTGRNLNLPYVSTSFNLLWTLHYGAARQRATGQRYSISIIRNDPQLPGAYSPTLSQSEVLGMYDFDYPDWRRHADRACEVVVPGEIPCSAVQNTIPLDELVLSLPSFLEKVLRSGPYNPYKRGNKYGYPEFVAAISRNLAAELRTPFETLFQPTHFSGYDTLQYTSDSLLPAILNSLDATVPQATWDSLGAYGAHTTLRQRIDEEL